MTDGPNAEVELLRARLVALESRLAQVEAIGRTLPTVDTDEEIGRRGLFKKMGLLAAGAVGASAVAAHPAAAAGPPQQADGDPLRWGINSSAPNTNSVKLVYTGINNSTGGAANNKYGFLVTDAGIAPTLPTAIGNNRAAIMGLAMNNAFSGTTGGLFQVGVAGVGTYGLAGYGQGGGSVGVMSTGSTGMKVQASTHLKLLDPEGGTNARPTGTGPQGALFAASDGSLWFNVGPGNTNGEWRQLTGRDVAGSFHPVNPTRVFDSRTPAGGAALIQPGVAGQKTVSLAVAVPAGAKAACFSLTATTTQGNSGYAAAIPGGSVWNNTSNINWSTPNDNVATFAIVGVNAARQIILYVGENATHLIVDVTGYWL
jgi:hypothetical protein